MRLYTTLNDHFHASNDVVDSTTSVHRALRSWNAHRGTTLRCRLVETLPPRHLASGTPVPQRTSLAFDWHRGKSRPSRTDTYSGDHPFTINLDRFISDIRSASLLYCILWVIVELQSTNIGFIGNPMTSIDPMSIKLLVHQHWPIMGLVMRRIGSPLRLPLGRSRDRSRREVRCRICLLCCVESTDCLCKICLCCDLRREVTWPLARIVLGMRRSDATLPTKRN